MNIVLDLEPFFNYINQPIDVLAWQFFVSFGWLPIAVTMLWGFKELWVDYLSDKWSGTQKKIFLAIDIPRGNMQSLRAVENLFTYLAGAHGSINLFNTYWEGKFQVSFSMEIASIDGYTQFIIMTRENFRYLVETAVYSQYPDAEIVEVSDYTVGLPKKFPDDEWDVFGSDYILTGPDAYPLRTYEDFEHQFGEPETTFRDPMSSMMDLCSSLRKGEQLWYQIIVTPIDVAKAAAKLDEQVKVILREDVKKAKNFVDYLGDIFMGALDDIGEMVVQLWTGKVKAKEEKKEDPLKMMNLKPKEKRQVEGIHHKTSKNLFSCKIRMIYIAKKDVMQKPKVVNGFNGFMKQFNAIDLNSLKPDTKRTMTSTEYFMKAERLARRQNNVTNNFMNRDGGAGSNKIILNTEELATLWHFPIESVVKAPLIQKAEGRKAQPPSSLPLGGSLASEVYLDPIFTEEEGGVISPNKELDDLFLEDGSQKKEVKKINEKKVKEEDIFTLEEEEIFVKNTTERGAPPSNLPFA